MVISFVPALFFSANFYQKYRENVQIYGAQTRQQKKKAISKQNEKLVEKKGFENRGEERDHSGDRGRVESEGTTKLKHEFG